MAEQIIVWALLLLMPYEVEVSSSPPDKETIRAKMIQIEIETRAERQRLTGAGL